VNPNEGTSNSYSDEKCIDRHHVRESESERMREREREREREW